MKPSASLFAVPLLFASVMPAAFAAEVVVFDWHHSWDYMHPMGADPKINDPDFNTTWFQKAEDFAVNYNGPAFGGVVTPGNAGDITTYDHGTAPGPFGYPAANAMEYFAVPGAELSAFGTVLTMPNTGSRYTMYFRTVFTAGQAYTSPRIRGLIDDSALIYLDGVLVARVNRANNIEEYLTVGADGVASRNETGASANAEACIQSIDLSVAGNAAMAEAVVITPVPSLAPGQHTLAVSVQNAANNSSDAGFGLELRADDAGISAAVSNVQRQDNGAGFADDTFTFDVTVTATNLPGAVSWTSNNDAARGPVTGGYAPATVTYTYPAQKDSGTLTTADIKFTDATSPLLTTAVSVTAPEGPHGPPLVLSAANPLVGTGFEEAGKGLGNFTRQIFNTELEFTSNGAVVQDASNNPAGSKMLRFRGVNALMTTEAVKLDPAVKALKAGVTVRAFTSSGTGFEGDDSLRVSVEGSTDGTVWTDIGSILPTLAGNDATVPNPAGIDQLLMKTGPGVTGEPEPISHRGWAAKGYPTGAAPQQFSDTLTLPSFTVPDGQSVQLEFTHRYSFELDPDGTRFDGGDVQVSIDGGGFVPIPGSAFTQNGYDGIITGVNVLTNLEGFNSDSPNYDTGFITSILTIPGVSAGSSVQIQFVGAWDYNQTGSNPNWQITDIKAKSGAATIYSEDFSTGDGSLIATTGWLFDNGTLHTGPSYFDFSRSAIPVPAGTQFVRVKLYEPKHVVLSTSEIFLIDHVALGVGLDPAADQDGDGVSNGLEDVAGTSLTDPLSAFKVTSAVVPSGNPGTWRATFTFPAADFRIWRLQSSDDLLSWRDEDTRYGDPALPSLSLFSDAAASRKYWRIAIDY